MDYISAHLSHYFISKITLTQPSFPAENLTFIITGLPCSIMQGFSHPFTQTRVFRVGLCLCPHRFLPNPEPAVASCQALPFAHWLRWTTLPRIPSSCFLSAWAPRGVLSQQLEDRRKAAAALSHTPWSWSLDSSYWPEAATWFSPWIFFHFLWLLGQLYVCLGPWRRTLAPAGYSCWQGQRQQEPAWVSQVSRGSSLLMTFLPDHSSWALDSSIRCGDSFAKTA